MFAPSTSSTIYYITLLRHAESSGNADGLHQGQSNFPLTDNGRAQARALTRRWKREKRIFDRIIASPLTRTRETAEIIASGLKVPIEYDPLWMERDIGVLQGLKPEDAYRDHPRPAFMHLYQPVGETGESQWGLYIRAAQAINRVVANPPGRYLVVTHGGILNLVMYAILGIAPQANFGGPRFRFANTSFTTLTYEPGEHKWSVLGVNDQAHWKNRDQVE